MPKSDKKSNDQSATEEPNFRLAIALEDLDKVDPIARQKMLAHRLDLENPIRITSKICDAAVTFCCKIVDAALICDILRSEDRKAGDTPTRIFLDKGEGWKAVPSNAVFTVEVRGSIKLNPQLFDIIVLNHTPLPVQKLTFGKKG